MKPIIIIGGMIVVAIALIVAEMPWLLALIVSAIISGVAMAVAEEFTEDR
jgi:membrane protein implicated in regulation of membrane protease activity